MNTLNFLRRSLIEFLRKAYYSSTWLVPPTSMLLWLSSSCWSAVGCNTSQMRFTVDRKLAIFSSKLRPEMVNGLRNLAIANSISSRPQSGKNLLKDSLKAMTNSLVISPDFLCYVKKTITLIISLNLVKLEEDSIGVNGARTNFYGNWTVVNPLK